MDRNRNRRKGLPRDENIVTSLEANQKRKVNNNDEDYESDNVRGKKERNRDDDEQRIFNCDIFHLKDPKKAKLKKAKSN